MYSLTGNNAALFLTVLVPCTVACLKKKTLFKFPDKEWDGQKERKHDHTLQILSVVTVKCGQKTFHVAPSRFRIFLLPRQAVGLSRGSTIDYQTASRFFFFILGQESVARDKAYWSCNFQSISRLK